MPRDDSDIYKPFQDKYIEHQIAGLQTRRKIKHRDSRIAEKHTARECVFSMLHSLPHKSHSHICIRNSEMYHSQIADTAVNTLLV